MSVSFDIFRLEAQGVLWVEAASTLDHAKTRVEELARLAPGEYLVLNHSTGEKIIIQPFSSSESLNEKRRGPGSSQTASA